MSDCVEMRVGNSVQLVSVCVCACVRIADKVCVCVWGYGITNVVGRRLVC
jgi:hypothetical protein